MLHCVGIGDFPSSWKQKSDLKNLAQPLRKSFRSFISPNTERADEKEDCFGIDGDCVAGSLRLRQQAPRVCEQVSLPQDPPLLPLMD
jgi:hypothetical protein